MSTTVRFYLFSLAFAVLVAAYTFLITQEPIATLILGVAAFCCVLFSPSGKLLRNS